MITKKTVISLFIFITCLSPQVFARRLANQGMQQIINSHKDSKQSINRSYQFRDIELACNDIIFMEWFDSYLATMKATPNLGMETIETFSEFAQSADRILDQNYQIYQQVRTSMVPELKSIIKEKRKNEEFPQKPGKLKLDDVELELLEENLSSCGDSDLLKKVNSKSPVLFDYTDRISLQVSRFGLPLAVRQYHLILPGFESNNFDPQLTTRSRTFGNWLNLIQFR